MAVGDPAAGEGGVPPRRPRQLGEFGPRGEERTVLGLDGKATLIPAPQGWRMALGVMVRLDQYGRIVLF